MYYYTFKFVCDLVRNHEWGGLIPKLYAYANGGCRRHLGAYRLGAIGRDPCQAAMKFEARP